jgi:hypothetical protein
MRAAICSEPADFLSNFSEPETPTGLAASGIHFDTSAGKATSDVCKPLKNIFAVWFILQIVVPFTAPLQTCDLSDLLGTHRHSTPASPESSTTPTTSETRLGADAFVSPLAVSALRASTDLAVVHHTATRGPVMSTFGLSPSPQVQQTVLRL